MEKKTNEQIINMINDVNLKEALQYIVIENKGILELHEARNGWMDLTVYADFFRANHLQILFKHSCWNAPVRFDKEKELMYFIIETRFSDN
jgi:hypothetical protein